MTALTALQLNWRVFGISTLCLVLASCGENTDGDPLKSAKAHLAKNDLKSAEVALKIALQTDLNSADARFLKGDLLLRQGFSEAAAEELTKARDLKYPLVEVAPMLARAQLATGQYKKVLAENESTKLEVPAAQADLLTSIAGASAMQGDTKRANELLATALQLQPGFPAALLAQARLRASEGQVDAALQAAESVLKQVPASAEAWKLKGDLLLHGKRQIDESVAAYRQAIAAKADYLPAHAAAVTALLLGRKSEEAIKQFEQLKAAFPENAQTAFFAAQIAMLKGDNTAAHDLFAKLLLVGGENARLLALAGTNELQMGALVQAEALLGKALKLAPEQAQIRRQLAQLYLRNGNSSKALDALKPLLARDDVDLESLYLAGMANLQAGNSAASDAAFARAVRVSPEDPRIATALALRKISQGDIDGGFAALTAIAAADKGELADLALIGMRMRRREHDAALTAVDVLDKKLPGQALVADLRGRVLLSKRDIAGARASFERALVLSPKYMPAAGRLAALDIGEQKFDVAWQRIETVLKADPKQNEALMALADLKYRQGGTVDEVAELYRAAQRANPTEKSPRMALVEFLLERRAVAKALVAAQEALVTFPNDVDVLDAVGRAQMTNGQAEQAISTYGKLASLLPESPLPLVRLAGAYVARNDLAAAAARFKRALDIAPNFVPAQEGLIQLAMRDGKSDSAIAVSRGIQRQSPASPLGYVLEGDIQRLRKNWAGAREAYQNGIRKSSSPTYLATKIHGSYLAEGRSNDADRFAESWQREHLRDVGFHFHLGMVALKSKDYKAAERQFRTTVDLQPANAAALNNLGWVLAELKKPGALDLIDQAIKRAPDRPEFLDTRAHALALAGDFKGAAEAQRSAADIAPEGSGYRLKQADYLVKAGDRDGARTLLQELANSSTSMTDKTEAKQRLGSL